MISKTAFDAVARDLTVKGLVHLGRIILGQQMSVINFARQVANLTLAPYKVLWLAFLRGEHLDAKARSCAR